MIPIIAIVGPTGVGKTKLSIIIAKALGAAEIVSVDSLQVYREAPIMTAQASTEEMEGVRHHLMCYLNAAEEPRDFVPLALKAIESIRCRGNIPILCGGSTSLMQPLLIHPYLAKSKRYILGLACSMSVLGPLLDARISQMVHDGLLGEVCKLLRLEAEHHPQKPCGVWKAIGYTELKPWASARSVDDAVFVLDQGLEDMRQHTRHYAETQMLWMLLELFPSLEKLPIKTKMLVLRSRSEFESQVVAPALELCKEWLSDHA